MEDGIDWMDLHIFIILINSKRYYTESSFAKETKHLICEKCRGFCKQECFI